MWKHFHILKSSAAEGGMREICTEIEIAGSLARVWEVLTRFDEYPQWNPFIPHVAVTCARGGAWKCRSGRPARSQ